MSHPQFDDLLSERLSELDLSQAWLARKLGKSRSAVARWYNGYNTPGSSELVSQIIEALDIEDVGEQEKWFVAAGFAAVLPETDEAGKQSSSTEGVEPPINITVNVTSIFSIEFFREATMNWAEVFVARGNAAERPASNWAAQVLAALRNVTGRMSPQWFLGLLTAMLLWLFTVWLVAPALSWPMVDVSTRQVAFLRFGAATLLIPLLVGAVTRADGLEVFELRTSKQKRDLWLLKITGALVAFFAFVIPILGVALAWYYLGQVPLSIQARAVLVVVPLFFSYVVARRVPAERYERNGKVEFWSADIWFLGVFAIVGLLTSLFVYMYYWLFADRVLGSAVILTALLVVTLATLRSRDLDAISDALFILLVGGGTTLTLLALSVYATSGSLDLSGATLPLFLVLSTYLLSVTLLGTTLFIRKRFTFSLKGAIGALLALLMCLLVVTVDLTVGRILILALLLLWFFWGRSRLRHHFHIPAEFWLLLVVIGVSVFLLLRTSVPLWVNAAGFSVLFALLMWRAYRHAGKSVKSELPPNENS